MNEEILNNIWNTLSSDPNLSIKAANFDEWKNSFTQDKNIQTSVYNYLKDNHTIKAATQEEWTVDVMGKTDGTQVIDAPVVPNVSLDVTESASELSSLGLSGDEFKEYETALENVFTETEVEMEEVVEIANSAPTKEYLATRGWIGQFEKTTVYPFQEFLNEDQSNKEEAKKRWIEQERLKIQTKKLEEVFSELKSDVMPLWTGPVGFLSKIAGAMKPESVIMTDANGDELPQPTLDEKLENNIGFGYTKKELEYEKVRNILHDEYTSKLKGLDAEGEKIVNNVNYSISQFDIIDGEIETLNARYKDTPPSSQEEVDYFNGLLSKRKGLYATYKSNLSRLNEVSVDLKSIESIADMVKRTYSNVQVMDNRITSTILKLQSGLIKTVKELTVGVEERFLGLDLNSEENLELVSDFMRPLARGMGNLGDALDKTSLELFEEAENINEFTKKRQALGEVSSVEDFGEFMLDLFSEQAVNTAITASTGGLGLIAVAGGAAGNKFTSMDMELENGRYNPRTGKMEAIKISPAQYYIAGVGYGLAEYVTEKVSLNNFKLGAKGFRSALDIAGGKYTLKGAKFSKALKNYGMSTLGEGSSELFASIFQNSLDRYTLENKEVGIMDGAVESFWSGAFMSGLGFNAPALAAAGYRAATPSRGWDKINENTKEILDLRKTYDQIVLGPKTEETLNQAKAIRERMDGLLKDNVKQKGLAEQRIDQLSNNEKRTLLDLESKRNRLAARIDKLSESKDADSKYIKDMVKAHMAQINEIESKKDNILNNAMFSSDMRKTTKLTLKDAILKGLNIKSITSDNNNDALKQALEHVDQSDLEVDQKKALKNKLKETFNQLDVHVHGFAVGKEQGLPMQFQMKSNATNAQSGNASVHSHELGHNSILAKIIEGNGDMLGLVDQFETYIRNRFKGLSEAIDQEGRFQLTQYATDAKSVKEELKKELGKEPTQDQIDDRVYLNKVSIAEEKLAASIDYIRKYHNEKIDKSFKGKLLDMWSKTRNADDVNEIQNGEDVYSMLTSFTAGFEKGEMSGLAAKVIEGKVKARVREAKQVEDNRVKAVKSSTDAINKLGKIDKDGNNLEEKGTGNFYYQAEADDIVKEIEEKGYLDGLIISKYKVEKVPSNFVKQVMSELSQHIKNYKPERKNDSGLFGWINPQISNKANAVYNREYKVDDEMIGAKDVDSRSKEGEVKVQVAAEKSSEMEAFEEEDLSITGQAKKEVADKQRYSEYRQKLGFETGSKIYNEVLENVKKSLMIAYGTTQNIKDVQLRAQAIAAKLKKEYAHLDSPLFKQIKNFLTYGIAEVHVSNAAKDIYFTQLKEFREDIVKNISTADLVQMERLTPDVDRIFTDFVKKLTTIKQVEDAINKEQLPPEALNKITKDKKTGKGSFSPPLYNKIMPTETELVSWADQPGKNPITGLRQGLKGTRKDGIAMRMVNSLVTDAIMEARQSEQVQERIAGMDIDPGSVAELGAAIGREVNVKFSKSNAIGDVSAAIDGSGDINVYSQIKFSKNHREAYEKQLTKRRPDLTENQRKNAVQSVFDFVDGKDIPNHLKSKYEKMAMHYTANGFLILPEDGYKVIEAEKIATKKKLDPFSFKNPNVLIETFIGEVKGTRTNPDNVKTFSNKSELAGGVTVYEVKDSKQGQKDVREVIDTHFGKQSNPWCLAARGSNNRKVGDYYNSHQEAQNQVDIMKSDLNSPYTSIEIIEHNFPKGESNRYHIFVSEGTELKEAWGHWNHYNKEGNGHKIAFQNGRLVAFRDGKKDPQWWDRNDKPSSGVVVRGKKGKDGFKPVVEVNKTEETILSYEKVTGDKKNGTTIKRDVDGSLISQQTKKNGRFDGENIMVDKKNKKSNEYYRIQTENYKDGSRINYKEERTYTDKSASVGTQVGRSEEIRLNNITKYERSFTERDGVLDTETIVIEGTINQKYFKEFNDPSSVIGWEKTNLPYLTPAYERYYGMQGQEVTVKQELTDKAKYSAQNATITIDGVVQEPRVKFSKSDVNYKKAQNAVKFSKMSSEAKTKLSVKLGVMQRNISEEETSYQLLGVILDNIIKYDTYQELMNATVKDVKGIYNENEAVQVENVLVEGVFTESHVKRILDVDDKLYLKEVREIAVENELKILGSRIKNLKDEEQQGREVVSFIKGKGRSIRSGQLKGIRTNIALFTEGIEKLLINDFLKENIIAYTFNGRDGRNKTGIKYKGKKITTFLHPSTIKRVTLSGNQTNIEEIRGETDKEAGVNFKQLINEYSDPKTPIWQKLASLELSFLDQMGPLRKSYPLGGHMVGKKYDSNNTTLEHNPPVVQAKEMWKQFIMGKIEAKDVKNWYADNKASVNVISNKLNDVLAAEGLSQKSNEGQNRYEHPSFVSHPDYTNLKFSKSLSPELINAKSFTTINKAVKFSLSANNPTKGITVLDFDDTLATSKSLIRFTRPDGTKGTLNAEQYASTYQELTELGYKWDFSEFTKVVDGKIAPLFQKALKLQEKFGNGNMFILTARPAESAPAIHAFLKANGLNIPLKNITGLANSTAEAKALWVAEKVGEGYNDFYFADDALQNVKAVKNMLDQFDVKSKVQQARIKFSKSMDPEFNDMLERTTGVPTDKIISEARAKKRGKKVGKYVMFVPPSAEDFLGLLYSFAGNGKQGDADLAFLKKSLIDPLNRAYTELDNTKQAIADDYRNLKKEDPDSASKLRKESPDEDFTYGDAVRVYLWNKSGIEIPGLNEKDQANLIEMVTSDSKLQSFADKLGLISRQEEGYTKPGDYWQVGDIRNDLDDATSKIGRKQFFTEFIENADIIFSEDNLNKIQSIYGSNFREALENILHRTKTGTNKNIGSSRLESNFTNWVNGSVAATMFINVRSSLLQNLSNVNFLNWGDNNPYKAAKAFANQKQYWADFSMIFNSAKLKQRRSGLGMDINANELATYMAKSKSSPKALLSWLLQKGFLPTQMADSFAISIGGASFYRNRVNTYLAQGMDAKKAEEQAWNDFSEISEATQQSARPDMVSQQQASPLGKFILNFQNTPMQYTRLIKKATIDLIKGRGDIKTNISRIVYYGAVQSMIFYGLQTALFAMMFSDDPEDEEFFKTKKSRVANGMVDSLLRGTGIGGAVVSTAKNMIIKFLEQKEKGYNKDESAVLMEFLNFSPVIGIKSRKIVSAQKGYQYNEDVIDHMNTFDIDNPVWGSVTSVVEGTTNVPLNRLYKKTQNVRAALDAENEAWQRLSLLLGFSTWDVGVENTEIDAIKAELKELNKDKKKRKGVGRKSNTDIRRESIRSRRR